MGGLSNPKIASTQFQPQTAPSTQTARQPSASFPGRFVSKTQGRQQQVTTNQFFNRAAEPASEPSARVAEAQLLTPTLPEGLTTGNSTYSPGSVRGLEKKLW